MAFEPSKHVNGRMWPPGVLATRMADLLAVAPYSAKAF